MYAAKDISKNDRHYTELSDRYDYMYQPIHEANTSLIINKLQLMPDDLLLDIGAATGQQAHLLWKHAGLKNAVTCVEPCKAFFEHARRKDGIVLVPDTAEQFCDRLAHGNNQKPFNKVLLCGAVHHIQDVEKHLNQIIDSLSKHGVLFIMSPPLMEVAYPFTSRHLQDIRKLPRVLDDIIPYVRSRFDVITEVTNEQSTFQIPKSRWYYMIRNRFWSSFRQYTDEDIEESIKELDNERFQGVKDDELISVVDKNIGIKITKK